MAEQRYRYGIVGGGLAGASAVEGIREVDAEGTIVMVGSETHLPYHRPPLSKGLWKGGREVGSIFIEDEQYYKKQGVELVLATTITDIDIGQKRISDGRGRSWLYDKLLLATGGLPRHLPFAGGDFEGVLYYRTLNDYLALRAALKPQSRVVVIGGGFIGSEMAAALSAQGVGVTMVFPELWLCGRVFSPQLGQAVMQQYREKGIEIVGGGRVERIERRGGALLTTLGSGRELESDLVVAGIGIAPAVGLAQRCGVKTAGGIVVDEYLRTSDRDIFAAGDNALFPAQLLGQSIRIEHWDNALSQGRHAGRVMAGEEEPFSYQPYFFSDLFDFGYEAVGLVDAGLDIVQDWDERRQQGVFYYLREQRVRGVLLCNVWEQLDAARKLIASGERVEAGSLRGRLG